MFDILLVGCWSSEENTNRGKGVVNSAGSVEECQSACINNASCTGVDWDGNTGVANNRRCWLHGQWSGDKGQANGVTHYTLDRNCAGKNLLPPGSLHVSVARKISSLTANVKGK